MAIHANGPPKRPARLHITAAPVAAELEDAAAATVTREPVMLRQSVTELLELSDYLDLQLRLRLAGWQQGFDAGYAAAERDMAQRWDEHARPIARADTTLMERRWRLRGEPRTRQTFGLPHKDDDPRRDGAA